MAVQLGAKPPAGFNEPIAMLKDCHRRIELFLAAMRRVVRQFGGGELDDDARRALQASLEYFATFAPHHTADEERSLFPRMRRSDNAAVRAALDELDHLEQDHRRADACHALADRLGRAWLADGRLDEPQRKSLEDAIEELAALYAAHIRLEEERVFALASESLHADELREIGIEMRRRRVIGDPAGAPSPAF